MYTQIYFLWIYFFTFFFFYRSLFVSLTSPFIYWKMRIYSIDVGHMNIGQRHSIAFYSFISSNSFISKASITFKGMTTRMMWNSNGSDKSINTGKVSSKKWKMRGVCLGKFAHFIDDKYSYHEYMRLSIVHRVARILWMALSIKEHNEKFSNSDSIIQTNALSFSSKIHSLTTSTSTTLCYQETELHQTSSNSLHH